MGLRAFAVAALNSDNRWSEYLPRTTPFVKPRRKTSWNVSSSGLPPPRQTVDNLFQPRLSRFSGRFWRSRQVSCAAHVLPRIAEGEDDEFLPSCPPCPSVRRNAKTTRFVSRIFIFLAAFLGGIVHIAKLWLLAMPAAVLLSFRVATKKFALAHPNITVATHVFGFADELFWKYMWRSVPWAGPAYIKFCQWAATRADLFGQLTREKLSKFHNHIAPHHFPDTVLALRQTIDDSVLRRMLVLAVPVGVGCVAQVHRAVLQLDAQSDAHILKDLGLENPSEISELPLQSETSQQGLVEQQKQKTTAVYLPLAVKVLHPGVESQMKLDLRLISAAAVLLNRIPFARYLAFTDAAVQFTKLMLPQLDLRHEALNMKRLADNFGTETSKKRMARYRCSIAVPAVLQSLCRRRVLFQSYEDGMSLGTWMWATRPPDVTAADHMAWNAKSAFLRHLKEEEQNSLDAASRLSQSISRQESSRQEKSNGSVAVSMQRKLRIAEQIALTFAVVARKVFGQIAAHLQYRVRRTSARALEKATGSLAEVSDDYGGATYWALVGSAGLAMFLQMVFVDNFVHADLHPGNILLRFRDPTGMGKLHPLPASRSTSARLIVRALLQNVRDKSVRLTGGSRFIRRHDESTIASSKQTTWNARLLLSTNDLPTKLRHIVGETLRNNMQQSTNSAVAGSWASKLTTALFGRPIVPVCLEEQSLDETLGLPTAPFLPSSAREMPQSSVWASLFSPFVGQRRQVDFELVILDSGLTTSLSARDYVNLCQLFSCVCIGDGLTAGKLLIDRARHENCPDREAFCEAVDALTKRFNRNARGHLRLQEAHLGEILSSMLQIACVHKVELDPSFVSLILAVIVLEGVGRQLDGDIDLLAAVFPYVKDVLVKSTVAGLRGVI